MATAFRLRRLAHVALTTPDHQAQAAFYQEHAGLDRAADWVFGVASLLRQKEPQFTTQPLEVDGKPVTAAGGRYVEHFGNAILEALQQ